MKLSFRVLRAGLLSISFLIILLAGCSKEKSDKIPITTSSKEALELFKKGRDLQERLQIQESRQYFLQTVEKDPNFAMAWLYLSFTEPTNMGFFEKLNRAVALVDKISEGEALWILGVEAGINGHPMQQRNLYAKLVELYPNDERAQNLMGIHYFGQQEWEKSIEYFTKATQINPNFSQPYNQLGYAYRFLENYNAAEIAFKKYIELIPNDPNPYDSYAELLMKMGRFDESISYYEKALEQNPNFVASYTGIALNLDLKGDYEAARTKLQELYDIGRNDAEKRNALFSIAVSYVFEGKMDKALDILQQRYAIAAQTGDAGAMAADVTTMGSILIQMGKVAEAGDEYTEANNLVQHSSLGEEQKQNAARIYLYNMARVALYSGDIDTAKSKAAEFSTAVTEVDNPLQIKLSHQLNGMIALEEKDWETALDELNQSSTDFNPFNFYRMGLAYEGMGDMDKARHYFEKAAHFNGLDGLNYAFCRTKALEKLAGK